MWYAITLTALWKCRCFVFQVYHWNPCDPEIACLRSTYCLRQKRMFVEHAPYIICYLSASVFWKQPLYLHEIEITSAYSLPTRTSPDLTCGIALALEFEVRHWCEVNLICPLLKTIARKAY